MTTDDTRARLRTRLRRWAWPLAVGAGIALTAVVTALLVPDATSGALDPRSAGETGTRALAQVLRARGVRVDVVRASTDAVRDAGAGDTIVVVDPTLLGPTQLHRLRDTAADLVLVTPDLTVLMHLAPGVQPAGPGPARPAAPACSDPDAVAAGEATGGGTLYRIDAGSAATGCYPGTDDPTGFAFVRLAAGGHHVTVLGQVQVLQNATLAEGGNAALALRALGAGSAVRWYLPDPLELGAAEQPGLGDLLPPWVRWVFWQLLIAVLVTIVWRARRLGRVVTEPLPVVVRSAETVEGRARLYRAGRARDRAAAVLRTAALRRLAARLGVPVGAPAEEVARLVAAASGRDERAVRDRLLGPAPRDDADLVALAAAVDEIESSVGVGPGGYGGARHAEGGGGGRP